MCDDCILVPLTQGTFAKIDAIDAERVLVFKWFFTNGYAKNSAVGYMHRFINGTPTGQLTDHINHDRLDNRRANLQTVSDSQSLHRRNPYGKSGFRGVRLYAKGGAWNARIRKDGIEYDLGSYRTAEAAAIAYNEKALELYGSRVLLNDVDASLAEPRLPRGHSNPSGERGTRAKLTDAQVLDIQRRAAAGERRVDLAREFGISYTHLKRLMRGKRRS